MLRVTLPLGMQLAWGTRVLVDHGQPMHAPYIACGTTGCFADYEASSELIEELKHAQGLTVEGMDGRGQTSSVVVPLAGFEDAYEGPAADPKAFEERLKQLAHEQPRAASPILK